MKYSLSLLAMAAGVFANYPVYSNTTTPVVYETITTTAITTYCPYATTVVHGGKTYTVTEATTLTITDCPCTVTQPVTKPVENPGASTVLYSSCPESATNPSMPDKTITPPVHTYTNPLHPVYPTGTGGGVVPTSPPFTGAASAKQIGGFAAAAVAGVVALVL